jgi:hypothetical protein
MINKIGKILLKITYYFVLFVVAAIGFGFDSEFDIDVWKV